MAVLFQSRLQLQIVRTSFHMGGKCVTGNFPISSVGRALGHFSGG